MNWKTIAIGLVSLPVLAMFTSAAFVGFRIGEAWDSRSTDSLIAGLTVACTTGGLVLSALLGLIVGIPLLGRLQESRAARAAPYAEHPALRALPGPGAPGWAQGAPQLEDKSQGTWQTMPGQRYDTWDDQQPIDAQWRGAP